MGFTTLPSRVDIFSQCSDSTATTHRSKSVRFDDNPITSFRVLTSSDPDELSSMKNKEELVRKVMHNILGVISYRDNTDLSYKQFNENRYLKTESQAESGNYSESNLNSSCRKRKDSSPSLSSGIETHRNILKRVNKKKQQGNQKTNVNNNFVVLRREELKVPNWREENVFNRTEFLAQPKPLPEGYREEKEPSYWITKKPPPIPKAGFTTSVATPRVEELAKPLYNIKGEFVGTTHCHWDIDDPPVKKVFKNPDTIDWDRLATPRERPLPSFNDPKRPVAESALKFEATKRLHQLAVPKKKIDCGAYYLWLWNKKPDIHEKLHQIRQLSVDRTDMEDARILLRCDLDYTEGKIIERKIKNILPTIAYAFKKKARAVIIISHCGNPNGKVDPKLSLECLMGHLCQALPENHVVYLDNCIGAEAKALCEDPEKGHVFLLENLRFHAEEMGFYINDKGEKVTCSKEAVEKFHDILMSFGDVYVNDAFTFLHEDATTNFGDQKKERCYGLHVKKELGIYNHFIVNQKKRRLVAVIGGDYDEVSDIISALMGKASEILLGGEIAIMFLHTVKGVDVGETKCSPYHMKKIRDMMTRARDTETVINLPTDVVVENINCPGCFYTGHTKDNIDDYYQAVDIGPLTRDCYHSVMLSADTLIWYGRMGTLYDGTCSVAGSFEEAYAKYGIQTYLLDNQTISYFNTFCPGGKVAYLTERSEVTMTLLHRKTPKSISSLSPWRRRVKKRPPKEIQVSTKPMSYESPCMKMCNALDRLSIDDLDLKDKKVIIRCDFNVPMRSGEVVDNFRIHMAVPSICYALQCGAHAVILISSLGDAYGKHSENLSLKPASKHLARFLHITEKDVVFVPEPTLVKVQAALKTCHPGTVLVVENINYREEDSAFRKDIETMPDMVKIASFCEELSCMGDVYVNDAFDGLQTPSASSCGIMLQKRACGFLLKNELRYLSKTFNAPPRPILVIIGGVYSKDKVVAFKSLLREIDEVIITGKMALAFLKVIHKMPTGASNLSPELQEEVPTIVELAAVNKVRIHYPVDFVVANELSDKPQIKQLSASVGVPPEWYAVDIGDNSCSLFKQVVKRSKLILWQGVAGVVEFKKFTQGTKTLLDVITEVTKDPEFGVVSIIGGNSNLSFAHSVDPEFQGVSHMTTGGLTCAAIIKDRCLGPIRCLSAGGTRQSLNKLAVKDLDIQDMSMLLRISINSQQTASGNQTMDFTSIKALVATITSLQKRGAKSVTVISSYGDPRGKKDEALSLLPFKTELEKKLRQEVTFFENGVYGASTMGASGGKVFMLENLSFHTEEQGWEDDGGGERVKVAYSTMDDYRRRLSHLGEVFINDSMESLCLCDSSVVGLSCKIKCAGPLLKTELTKFSKFLEKMNYPVLVIMGSCGSSTNTHLKLELLYDLLDQVTNVALCGDLASTYIKVTSPQAKLGKTPFDPELAKLWPRVLYKAKLNKIKFHLPVDFLIDEKVEVKRDDMVSDQPSVANPTQAAPNETTGEEDVEDTIMVPLVKTLQEGIGAGQRAMDIGPETVDNFQEIIEEAGSVVVMGPMGEFEEKDYDTGSRAILEAIRSRVVENGTPTIAIDQDTYRMLESLDKMDAVSHCSLANRSSVNMLRNMLLPGLELLDQPKLKPLKKLSMDRFNISGKRVLLRLDLDIPMVGGVILDVSKIELVLPTIQYLLDKGAKSVVMLGHRGQPHGFKNTYLSMEPLAAEFAKFLNVSVNFLPYPCSSKVREILEDPEPGSVFLMENLKFYPAEEGRDILRKTRSVKKITSVTDQQGESDGGGEEEEKKDPEETFEFAAEGGEEMKEEENEEKEEQSQVEVEYIEEDELLANEGEVNDEYVLFKDPEDLDRLMYEKMAPKRLLTYIDELSECGDIFVNDNPRDLETTTLTSMTQLTLKKRMCGLLVKEVLSKWESDAVYKFPAIVALSPAPKEGEIDDM